MRRGRGRGDPFGTLTNGEKGQKQTKMRQAAYCTRGGCPCRSGTRDLLPGHGQGRGRASTVLTRPCQCCRAQVRLGPSPVQRVQKSGRIAGPPGIGPPLHTRLLPAPPGRPQSRPRAVLSAAVAVTAAGRSSPPGPTWPWSEAALQTRLSAQAP